MSDQDLAKRVTRLERVVTALLEELGRLHDANVDIKRLANVDADVYSLVSGERVPS